MIGREPSPEQPRPSEPLHDATLRELMDGFTERLFVHGIVQPPTGLEHAPREIQYNFDLEEVQRLLERLTRDEGLFVTEAYAVYERDTRDSSINVILAKQLLASPSHDPITEHSWYTFTDDGGHVDASYGFEFVQNGRTVMDSAISTTMEERLYQAIMGSSDRQRPLFGDDETVLRALLELIGQ